MGQVREKGLKRHEKHQSVARIRYYAFEALTDAIRVPIVTYARQASGYRLRAARLRIVREGGGQTQGRSSFPVCLYAVPCKYRAHLSHGPAHLLP